VQNLNSRMFPMIAAMALCQAAEAQTSTGSAPSTNDAAVAAPAPAKRAPKNPDNKLNIINGRLPLALVHMIRFHADVTPMSTADKAKMFGTSVGKVFDIVKGRNFGYIDATYKPSAEEAAAAKAWCETGKTAKGQSLGEAGGNPTKILEILGTMGVATAEEVAKRNWNIRQVGASTAAGGEAPTVGSTAPAAAPAQGQPAEKPAGAKLF
jgi:hypothetical protein